MIATLYLKGPFSEMSCKKDFNATIILFPWENEVGALANPLGFEF